MKKRLGPHFTPNIFKDAARNMQAPLMGVHSGEITASVVDAPIGVATVGGTITGVWLSVKNRGADAGSNNLAIAADIKVAGTSCLTTQPAISKSAAAARADTFDAATGITQAVIDKDNDTVATGDLIEMCLTLTRTTPETEIQSVVVTLDIEPFPA